MTAERGPDSLRREVVVSVGPIISIRVQTGFGPHAQVTVFVNHARAGSLVMRTEEADAFVAALEEAARG